MLLIGLTKCLNLKSELIMKNYFLVLILSFFFSNLLFSQNKSISYSSFIDKQLLLSTFTDEVTYISLDSKKTIGIIDNLVICRDNIFIHSPEAGIYRYSVSGKFLNEIGKIGRGPNEYTVGSQFDVNAEEKMIHVLNKSREVLNYSYDGNKVSSFKISFSPDQYKIRVLNKDKVVIMIGNTSGQSEYNWFITDKKGNVIFKKDNSVNFNFPFFIARSNSVITYKFNENVYYFEEFNDTIFCITDKSYFPSYIIKNDRYRYNHKSFINDIHRYENPKKLSERPQYFIPKKFLETDDYLFIMYNGINKHQDIAVLNKENNEIYRQKSNNQMQGISNNIDGGISFYPQYSFFSNSQQFLVQIVFPYQLKEHVRAKHFKKSNPKYPEKKKELEELANSLDENDNPVLMLVKLKK